MSRGWLRRLAIGTLALAVSALVLAGCGKKKNVLVPNVPPQTTLFVQGPVDSVNHNVHLYWFGSDPDGRVVGFEFRFFNPSLPADTQWVFTTKTDSLFTVYDPTGLTHPRFEVRAVDDEGARDDTPAVEDFTFTNLPPKVRITSGPGLRDTTYAGATFTWSPTDPDGDTGRMTYKVWLDGNEGSPHAVTGTSFTVPSADFLQGGQYLSGWRILTIEPTDDGGRVGARDSIRWYVRAPADPGVHPRLLLVDDMPRTAPAAGTVDTMWYNAVKRNLPAGSYSILQLEFTQPFRIDADVTQTFKLFDAVIWYRGTQLNFPSTIQRFQNGITAYIDGGGRFFAEGLHMIDGLGASGAFDNADVSRYFGSDRLFLRTVPPNPADSTISWGIASGSSLSSSAFGLKLTLQQTYEGLRCFQVRDSTYGLLWARTGALSQGNPIDMPVVVLVDQPSGGQAGMTTVPLRGSNGLNTAPAFLDGLLRRLGVATGP